MRDLVPFVQLKKREKHSWGSVTCSSNTPPWVFFPFLNCRNGAKSHKASRMIIYSAPFYSFAVIGLKHTGKRILTKFTAQKMKFSIKDFFSKYDQVCRKLRIWSHLLKNSLMENFIFRAMVCRNIVNKLTF